MGTYVNSGNIAFQEAVNSRIYIDKSELILYTNSILNTNPAWVLGDGTIIGFYQPESDPFTKIFFMDINGNKKPNKWGYDIFAFMVMSDKQGAKLYIKPGGCSYIQKGGKSGKEMLE